MKKKLFISLIFFFQVSTFHLVQAQKSFDACLFGGVNFCQIDGDQAGSYSHLGLRGGIGTSFILSWDERTPWRMVVELAFTQKGSNIHREGFRRTIALNYVELPVMMSYTLAGDRLRLAAGVAPAVQVGALVVDNGGERNTAQAELYKRFDWLPVTFTARYLFTDNLAIEARFQNSMLSVTNPTASGVYRIFRENKGTFNRLVSVGLSYTF